MLTSLEDLDQYEKAWEGLRVNCHAPIFSSYHLTKLWLKSFHESVQPQVVIVEDKGEVVGVAPLCSHRHSAVGIPVRTLSMIGSGRHESLVGYSILGLMVKDADERVAREMIRGLRKAKWNLMLLFDLEPNPVTALCLDIILAELDGQPSPGTNNIFYEFPPDGGVEANFGRHTRKVLRGIRRGLEREGRMQFRTVSSVEGAEAAMRLYVEQHAERWAKKGGSMFRDARNAHQLVETGKLAYEKGIGAIYELLIDGEVAAQVFSLFDFDIARGYRIGMIDKFREYSPGKLTMMLAMEDLRSRGFKGLDLLRGTEDYKYHMMTHERTLPAVQAQRGSLQMMSKVRNFPPIQHLDERLRVRERILHHVYR